MIFTMKETRSSVLLMRLARKLRKETGDDRYRARIEDERGSLRSLILISLTRPISEYPCDVLFFGVSLTLGLVLLITEPVVSSFSVCITSTHYLTLQLNRNTVMGRLRLGHFIRPHRVRSLFPSFPRSLLRYSRSVSPAFSQLHHFTLGQVGSVFATLV